MRETAGGKFFYDYRLSDITTELVSDTPGKSNSTEVEPFRPITSSTSNVTLKEQNINREENGKGDIKLKRGTESQFTLPDQEVQERIENARGVRLPSQAAVRNMVEDLGNRRQTGKV